MMSKTTLIKSYAYFKGELQRAYENDNEKLINYYTDEIQRLLTNYYSKNTQRLQDVDKSDKGTH